MIGLGLIGWKIEGRQDAAQEQPGSELAGDEVGVFALPAETRLGRQRLFHQRGRVDEHAVLAAQAGLHAVREVLEPALDQLVIVAALGVDRDEARGSCSSSPSSGS